MAANSTTIGPATASSLARKAHSGLVRHRKRDSIKQGVELQQLAYETVKGLGECPSGDADEMRAHAQAVAALLRGWDCVCERLRMLAGVPSPGSLKPEPKPKPIKAKSLNWLPPSAPRTAPKVAEVPACGVQTPPEPAQPLPVEPPKPQSA